MGGNVVIVSCHRTLLPQCIFCTFYTSISVTFLVCYMLFSVQTFINLDDSSLCQHISNIEWANVCYNYYAPAPIGWCIMHCGPSSVSSRAWP